MENNHSLRPSSTLRFTLSQALARSLQILEMPQIELAELMEEEAEKNPLLDLQPPPCRTRPTPILGEPSAKISLFEHLLGQLRESFPDPSEQKIAEAFVHHLDERGFLATPLSELAAEFQLSMNEAASYLDRLQAFDPPGIFARDLQEAFLLQLKTDQIPFKIVSASFHDLLRGRYAQIKKKHQISASELSEAIHALSKLSQRPAAQFESAPVQFIQPDLRITHVGNQWIVENLEEQLPLLSLKTEYLSIPDLPPSEKHTLRQFTTAAKWLIRSIQKRKKFLVSLASYLVRKQAHFLNQKGDLSPISPQELAEQFHVHESTIYRALAGKYLDTPAGLVPLSTLAPSSSHHLAKELLRKLIAQEDKLTPLTDDQISLEMKKAGCEIARRTIAKYRKQLNIRSASARKNLD